MTKKPSNQNLLLLGAAGIAAWYFFTRAGALNNLNFVPLGLGVVPGGVSVQLGVQNPTNTPITLNSFVGSLSISGSPVGSVSTFTPVTIAPNSQTPLSLYVGANYLGLASGVLNQLEGNEGSGNYNAVLSGTANVNGIALPINVQLN